MDFAEYQKRAESTAIYQNRGNNLAYPALGLAGEAGEVAEKIKRVFRGDGEINDEFRQQLKKELGDVLWYVAMVSHELGFTIDDVARLNVEKLASRKERGKLHGQGDDR